MLFYCMPIEIFFAIVCDVCCIVCFPLFLFVWLEHCNTPECVFTTVRVYLLACTWIIVYMNWSTKLEWVCCTHTQYLVYVWPWYDMTYIASKHERSLRIIREKHCGPLSDVTLDERDWSLSRLKIWNLEVAVFEVLNTTRYPCLAKVVWPRRHVCVLGKSL